MGIKFLDIITPEHIAEMCKEGIVKVSIEVIDRIKEETITFEGGERVTRLDERILSHYGREIRSWNDLFTTQPTDADKASWKVMQGKLKQNSLNPQLRKNLV